MNNLMMQKIYIVFVKDIMSKRKIMSLLFISLP